MNKSIRITVLSVNNLAIVTESEKDRFILDADERAKLDDIISQLNSLLKQHDKI